MVTYADLYPLREGRPSNQSFYAKIFTATSVYISICDMRLLNIHWPNPFLDTLVGRSCRTLLSDTLVGHSCGTLLRNTLVGHFCRTLLWDTLVGQSCIGHSSLDNGEQNSGERLKHQTKN